MELTKTTELTSELQLQVTEQEERHEVEHAPVTKIDTYRQQSRQMIEEGLVKVGELHLKSMEKADELATVRYQRGAEAQKAAKDKKYRDKVLKGLKKQDTETFQGIKAQSQDMQKVVDSGNANSPRALLGKAKDAYQRWRSSRKKMNLILFRKEMDEEYEAELRKTESIGMDVSTMEKIGGMDAKLVEREKEEEEEKKKLSSLEQEKDKTERVQNLDVLLSEDPLLEIRKEILDRDWDYTILEFKEDEAINYKRTDLFGIDRREHMEKYAKSGRITSEDLKTDDELVIKGKQALPKEKRKVADTLREDINNLLNNIRVDQIEARENYEFPESLMAGLKGFTLFKGIVENVGADKKLAEDETAEKIKLLEEQIKRYEEREAELKRREADIRTLIEKSEESRFKTGKKDVLEEKEEKLRDIEEQKEKLREKIEKYETEKQELTLKGQQQRAERKEWEKFTFDMSSVLNRQINTYNVLMRELKAIRVAKQIVADSPAGDYRDSMMEILTDRSREVEDKIDSSVRSMFQKKVESTQTTKELTDHQLEIMMGLANLYDEIRAKRERLPKKPDHEESPDEKKEREDKEEPIKQEVQQLMEEARRLAES